jgi:hypothetical protein
MIAPRGPLAPGGILWLPSEQAALDAFEAAAAENGFDATCSAFDGPLIAEEDGKFSAYCPSIGVVYAPPFTLGALAELLFPDDWSILPPG